MSLYTYSKLTKLSRIGLFQRFSLCMLEVFTKVYSYVLKKLSVSIEKCFRQIVFGNQNPFDEGYP